MDSSKFIQSGSVLEVNLDKVMEEGSKALFEKVLLEQGDHAAGAEAQLDLEKMAVSSNQDSEDPFAVTQESSGGFFAEFKEKMKQDKTKKSLLRKEVAEQKTKELQEFCCKELLDQLAEKGMKFLSTGKEEYLQAIEEKFGSETKEIHLKCFGKTLQVWLSFLQLLITSMEIQLAQTGKISKEQVYKAMQELEKQKCADQQLEQSNLLLKLSAALKQDLSEDPGSSEGLLKEFKQLCQPMLDKDLEEEIFTQISLKVGANLMEEIGYKLKKNEYGSFQILGKQLMEWADYLKCTPNKYTAESVALEKNVKGKLLMLGCRMTLEALGLQQLLSEASCFKLNSDLGSGFSVDVLQGLKSEAQGYHCKKPNAVESNGKVQSSIKALENLKPFLDTDLEVEKYTDLASEYPAAAGQAGDYKALGRIFIACSKENLVQLGHLQHEVIDQKWSNKELLQTLQKAQDTFAYTERRLMDFVSKPSCFERTVFHGFDDHQENCMPLVIRDKLLQRSQVKQKEFQLSMNLPLCFTFLRKFLCGKSLVWEETVKEFDMALKKPWEVKELEKLSILKELAKKDADLQKQLEKAEKEAKDSLFLAKVSYAEEAGAEEAEDKVAEKYYYKDTKELKVVLTQLERVKYYWRGQDALKQLAWVKKQPFTKGSEKYTF